MKLLLKNILTLLLILFTCGIVSVSAQQLSTYNLQHLPQRNYQNPSFIPGCDTYIGIPLFSSVAFNYSNNGFSYADIISRGNNDSLNLNLTDAVNNLNVSNHLTAGLEMDLFALGLKFGKNYFTLNVTEKIHAEIDYSKNLMEFLVFGNAPSIGINQNLNPGIEAAHYREYGFAWSKVLSNKITAGLRIKYLYGMEQVYNTGSGVNLYTNPNDFTITANSDMVIHTSGLDSTLESFSFGNYAFGKNNHGYGMDLGITWKPVYKIELSASVIDLGKITWKENVSTYTTSSQNGAFEYNGINLNEFINDDSTSGEQYLEQLVDSLYNSFNVVTSNESYKYKLPMQLYLSATYLITDKYKATILIRNKKLQSGNITDYQFGFTGMAGKTLNYTVSLNRINKTAVSPGAGFTLNFKSNQLYFVSDNILSIINWKKSYNTGFRAGYNLVFGNGKKPLAPQPVLQ